jgi:hypothetical protein
LPISLALEQIVVHRNGRKERNEKERSFRREGEGLGEFAAIGKDERGSEDKNCESNKTGRQEPSLQLCILCGETHLQAA